ncbi:MAG TPA: L-seryl-tRNA(Sec) selenium transferase [Gemmataceae bacterium]
MSNNPLRKVPAVSVVLQAAPLRAVAGRFSHARQVAAIRDELARLRERLSRGETPDGELTPDAIAERALARLERAESPGLRRVINATGVVLHTNLGRSPVAGAAAQAAFEAARGYLNLELDLTTGKRSSRQAFVRKLLCELTGAESATAVNNCAAATVIALRAVAAGKEVIVSRGQLIEIGGSFRIPEIMAVSGARLREVGTTNITRPRDYEAAIGPDTAALMLVHPSNYRVRGFTRSVPLEDLVALGRRYNLPVIDDCGSGAMIDFARFGLAGEPVIPERVRLGADLVLCSGDKLLGGPQAGLIVGRRDLVERVEKDPLMRAFRLDKMALAALEATLLLYRDEEQALREIPTLRLIGATREELRRRAKDFAVRLRDVPGLKVTVREDVAYVGGGSVPDQALPAAVIALRADAVGEAELAARLRTGNPAVLARTQRGRVLLDLRTVFPGQEVELLEAVRRAVAPDAPAGNG